MFTLLGSDRGNGMAPNRREILRAGGLGMLGLTLPRLLELEAMARVSGQDGNQLSARVAKCKSVK